MPFVLFSRLAAEALSLSQQSERELEKISSKNHDTEQKVLSDKMADVCRDNLDEFHSNATGNVDVSSEKNVGFEFADSEMVNVSPSDDYSSSNSKLECPHLSNYESDIEKNSILYDLLSGRENLHTACHRSRLFLSTIEKRVICHDDAMHLNGTRRRKPLRPVKNVNTTSETKLVDNVIRKFGSPVERSSTDSSILSLVHRNGHNHLSKRDGREQRFQRRELMCSVYKKKYKGKYRNPMESLNDTASEQPLDLSAPKFNRLSSNRETNGKLESLPYYPTNRIRKKFRGYEEQRHQNVTDSHHCLSNRKLRSGENAYLNKRNKIHQHKAMLPSTPTTHYSAAHMTTGDFVSLIPNLMNVLFSPSSSSKVHPGINLRLNLSPSIESGVSIPIKESNADQVRVLPIKVSQIRTHSVSPKQVAGSGDIKSFLEFYDQILSHSDVRGLNAVRGYNFTNQLDSFSSHTSEGVCHSPERPNCATNALHDSHAHLTRSHQESVFEQLKLSSQRTVHPLVDRILSTLHAINPAIKNVPGSLLTCDSLNHEHLEAGLSLDSSLTASSPKATSERCTSPIELRVGHSVSVLECLTKLRLDPILNYLVQFIRHPEALLVDCFSPTIVGELDHKQNSRSDDDDIVQRLSIITLQLLARTETGRIELFRDSWHLLYLLCAMERGQDPWTADGIVQRHLLLHEGHNNWKVKLDLFSKLRRLNAQMNLSTQMFNLLRGFLLNHGESSSWVCN